MESYEGIRKQLSGLIMGIKECNFIPWQDKQDITQNTWVKIIEKMDEGVIVDDAFQVRGYVFQVLRNFCLAYHRNAVKKPKIHLKWDIADEDNSEYLESIENKKSIIFSKLQAGKYNDRQREYIRMILEDESIEVIMKELKITDKQIRGFRQGLVMKLRGDLTRPIKYLIRNKNNNSLQIPCFTYNDVKDFFEDIPIRRIKYMIHDGFIDEKGFYVETLIKRKRKGSPE